MTREHAIQIATNFYRHRQGEEPQGMIVKRMEPAGGRITIWTEGYDDEIDEEFHYEIEIDPISDSVTMKRILAEYKASDFLKQKKLSELHDGDLFRLEGDCVIYEYWKPTDMLGEPHFLFTRKGKTDSHTLTDRMVYPCGK